MGRLMSIQFSEDIILAKVAAIRKCVGVIRKLWFENDPVVPDWVRLDVTVLHIQRAVEACLDLANHLIATNSWGLAGSAIESIGMLVDNQLIPSSEIPIYHGMIGFRNIAVHNYRDVDQQIVTGIVHDHLDDLERFAVRVLEATVNRG